MSQITIPVVMVTFLGQRLRQPIVNACTFTIQRRLFSPESLSFGIISHLILIKVIIENLGSWLFFNCSVLLTRIFRTF